MAEKVYIGGEPGTQDNIEGFVAPEEETKVSEPTVEPVTEPTVETITPEQTTEGVKGFEEGQVEIPGVNTTDVTAEVTPEPVEQITTAPVVTPEEIPVTNTEVKETDTPITDAQTVKSNELANKEAERVAKEQETIKAKTDFQQAIESGATSQELSAIMKKYPDSKDDFRGIARNFFKNKANVDYYKQYANTPVSSLYESYNKGDIVIGSDKYGLLPEAKRAELEQYIKTQNVNNIEDPKQAQEEEQTRTNSITSLESIQKEISGLFSNNFREEANKVLNSEAITSKTEEIEDTQKEINDVYAKISKIENKVRKEYSAYPESIIQSMVNDRASGYYTEIERLQANKSATEATLTNLKSDAQTQLALMQYEDGINRDAYNTSLKLYESRRSEVLAGQSAEAEREYDAQMAEFEAQNAQKALDIKYQRELEMKAFESQLDEESKGGVYETDREGRQVYIKNGVSTFVRSTEGEILFTEDNTEQGFKDTTTKEDGVYVTVRTYDDGSAPDYYTYDINGNSSTNSNNVVNSLVSGVTGDNQCGEAVNKYVTGQLGISSEDFWMGDSYDSKKRYINGIEPTVGGLAIWNSQGAENGHTGIVTGYNQENGTVQITDWNWSGDEKKQVHDVKISDIIGSDGGFYNPDSIPKAAGYDSSKTPLYSEYWSDGGLSTGKWNAMTSEEQDIFTAQAEIYQKEKTEQGTTQIKRLFDIIDKVIDTNPGRTGRLIASTGTAGVFNSDYADYQANIDSLKNNVAFAELVKLKASGASFGSLTETEFENIGKSATNISATLSDEAFTTELQRLKDELSVGLSEDTLQEWNTAKTPIVEENNVSTNGYDAYKNRATSSGYDYTKYQ